MSSTGLSLVGFMDEAAAIAHLSKDCVPIDPTESALRESWQQACTRLGAPTERAGNPEILAIPSQQSPHLVTLMQAPLLANVLQSPSLAGAKFHLIEIDPLLAFQFTVDTDRATHHCKGLSAPPSLDELMPICLPTASSPETMQVYKLGQSLLIKARCLNLRILANGWFQQHNAPTIAGAIVGLSLPLAHVVRWDGRCYLHNGFHRAIGARMAGATHIPCLFREVADEEAVGIKRDGTTFNVGQLTSANPPTVGHFTNRRAWPVRLRAHSRIVQVNWSEFMVYDE